MQWHSAGGDKDIIRGTGSSAGLEALCNMKFGEEGQREKRTIP